MLTTREINAIADKVAERIRTLHDDIIGVEEAMRQLGASKSWIYKHKELLGGKKVCGKLFFSRHNITLAVRQYHEEE